MDWLILLTGVYTAVSPWVIYFARINPYLTANNLIVGLAVTVLAFGIPLARITDSLEP
ncbi:SPW repeat protein [Streptomyces bungoensis]|uniref:SPW repeat protein n=1 Tax=Streptomyces bungoensis TaxID=285568 RepID=UPI000B1272C9|nr:SPW repeat protein [Streptomyces bungoensis]